MKGGYVRDAYLRGLTLSEKGLTNPFKFGVIGSSDTHVAGGSYTEETHFSKIGLLDGEPYLRGSVPYEGFYGFFTKLLRPDSIVEVDGNNYLGVSARLISLDLRDLQVYGLKKIRESQFTKLSDVRKHLVLVDQE